MDNDVSIVIATYGDDKWEKLALNRALPSAENQHEANEIVVVHLKNGTAATCKNTAITQAKGPWIVICDADDELEDDYVKEMKEGYGRLRYPMVRVLKPGFDLNRGIMPAPIRIDQNSPHLRERNLLHGNFMVIGTMFRKEDFEKVGGFKEFETWEDWFLFLQLTYIGADPQIVPRAVYRVYQHENSRVYVHDPLRVFNEMKEEFKKWALQYNNGQTENNNYKKFIGGE